MTTKEADQVPQSARAQEDGRLILRWISFQLWHGQIGPVPTNGGHASDAQSHQYPRCSLAPEHSPHAPRLAAVRAGLRNNRHSTSAECNMRCCLLLA
jgi:hypothetical protein